MLVDLTPADQRADLERKARPVQRTRGQTLYSDTAQSTDVYFIIEGEVQMVLRSSTGREVWINHLGPGASFGELAALDGLPRSASVVAVTDVRLRAISQADFVALLAGAPHAALWVARRLCADVRRLSERVFELSALNVSARLHCELLRMARAAAPAASIKPAPTHAELADRIGANREAVTREMRELARRGVVSVGRRSLEFVDASALTELVRRAVGE